MLICLGNWQRPGIDFVETFSSVARMPSFRMTLALAAELNLKVYGGDFDTARKEHMYVVRKALYGLRQAGRE
ncbi:unnamed protein product [Peronospora effusa]|uniref:Uncharacterized protein n=1 Tax=Peronospora effusa TaxID=542832 RepID=A0A3M6V865_9STRA|nr:hypothetical protein DD238_008214 [Peronospora effusa]CAI5721528.1 unnamed protein product [Peronospora effusa]